jgi:hypothetical protein
MYYAEIYKKCSKLIFKAIIGHLRDIQQNKLTNEK